MKCASEKQKFIENDMFSARESKNNYDSELKYKIPIFNSYSENPATFNKNVVNALALIVFLSANQTK